MSNPIYNKVCDSEGVPELIQYLGYLPSDLYFWGVLFNGAQFRYSAWEAKMGICSSLIDKYGLIENPYIRANLEKLIIDNWSYYAERGKL